MLGRRALRTAALVAASCVPVAAVSAVPNGVPNAAPNAATTAATTAGNRQAAIQDAASLLAGVTPPAGAVLQSSGTAIGPHAPLLILALASAVAYSTWSVPSDPASVLSFVQAHLPPGSKVITTGYGGPSPPSQSVTRSWPPLAGVLDGRWVGITVTAAASGGTLLYAEAQSQWVVTRPASETIPRGVREVDVTSSWPGKSPFLSLRVTSRSKVRRLVVLFDSLGRLQPVGINCPAYSIRPIVRVAFRAGATDRLVAEAGVSSAASFPWPASAAGWACFPITFTVLGRRWGPLVGNVITPIQRLLDVRLSRLKIA
jgi:hypothetical protein